VVPISFVALKAFFPAIAGDAANADHIELFFTARANRGPNINARWIVYFLELSFTRPHYWRAYAGRTRQHGQEATQDGPCC
jgi:hypothetical protein